MLKLKPYSASMLALGGGLLIIMGIYFSLLRPALLPEDIHYMKASLAAINDAVPDLSVWLQKVFFVMGGYIFTTGILIVFISFTSFRNRLPGAFIIVAFAGISSIGSMVIVNFIIGSNFRWVLLAFTMPWLIALILYRIYK